MRKIILDPYPRKKEEIFVTSSLKNLNSKYKIIEFDGNDRLDFYNMHIEEVSYIIGQPKPYYAYLDSNLAWSKLQQEW